MISFPSPIEVVHPWLEALIGNTSKKLDTYLTEKLLKVLARHH